MCYANLGVAFGVKLRYIARCRFAVEKIAYVSRKERRQENTNQLASESKVLAGKNTRAIEKPSGSSFDEGI